MLSKNQRKLLKKLLKKTRSANQRARVKSLEAINRIFDEFEGYGEPVETDLINAILDLTSDNDRAVAAKAAGTLGAFTGLVSDGMKAPIFQRLQKLLDEPEPEVFEASSWSLVRLQELMSAQDKAWLVRKLIARSAEEDTRSVMTSLLALGEIRFIDQAEIVSQRLLEFTRHSRPDVRAQAAKSSAWYKFWLPQHRRVEVIETLLNLTGDADEGVRDASYVAIERGSEVGLVLFPHFAPFAEAIPPSHHRKVIDRFVALTRDDSVFVQRGVTHALGNICNRLGELSDGAVVRRLLELVDSRDEHIRRNAVLSLEKIRELIPAATRETVEQTIRDSRLTVS